MSRKIDDFDIKEIAESTFESILEEFIFYMNVEYYDMSSKTQRDYLIGVKTKLDTYFEKELDRIQEEWSDKDDEMVRLENENKRLRQQLANANKSWSEDMGA